MFQGANDDENGATMSSSLNLANFRGTLICPKDEPYDEARSVFNGMMDRYPAAIARCTSTDDVVAVVNMANSDGLPLSVYGGGHSVTGSAVVDGGLCLDLRGMRNITVDPGSKTARVEGGAVWGEIDAATQQHGLAVTGGRVSTTGVGGLTLGSGSGWTERSFGFTCDNLLKAEVVTADGRVVIASNDENPDLFWGLRGGGGNFGVVTAFHFRLHDLGPIVLGGMLMFPATAAHAIVRFYRDFMAAAPNELGTVLAFITAPPEEFVPVEARGKPAIAIAGCHTGSIDEASKAFQPLRDLDSIVDMIGPTPYVAIQQMLDNAAPKGIRNYWTADSIAELTDDAVDVLVDYATNPVSPFTQVILAPGGGAIAEVADEATAFGQRNAPWTVHYASMWADSADDQINIAYTKELAASMKPWTTGQVYLNFIGNEGSGRVAASFGPEKYQRLTELKRKWDPTNLFRHNQNIPPAPPESRAQ